jgi:hypothetical protein
VSTEQRRALQDAAVRKLMGLLNDVETKKKHSVPRSGFPFLSRAFFFSGPKPSSIQQK